MPSVEDSTDSQHDCMTCWLEKAVRDRGQHEFFRCDDKSLTFSELYKEAKTLASSMLHYGLRSGDRVATLAYNSTEYLVVEYACLLGGLVWAPLNVSLKYTDLIASFETLRPQIILADSDEILEEFAQSSSLLNNGIPVFALDRDLAATMEGSSGRDDPERSLVDYHWQPDELCWVIQSGATSGMPKAIAGPHGQAMDLAVRMRAAVALESSDVIFSSLQMSHGWINHAILSTALMTVCTVVTTRWFSASRWLKQAVQAHATIVDLFLPMATAVVAQKPAKEDHNHKIRCAVGAYGSESESAARQSFESRFGIQTVNVYGLTETGALISRETLEMRRQGSVGKPHPHYEIAIDEHNGWTQAPCVEGEIIVRPRIPNIVALGYLGAPDAQMESRKDLWVHTGDIGAFDEDGYLYVRGRMSHWVRRKGENISTLEVELALRSIDGVGDAAVFGVPSEMGDEELAAQVVMETAMLSDLIAVRRKLAEKIAYFKVPRFMRSVSNIPRTLKGDPDRRKLKHDFNSSQYSCEI